MLLDIDERKKAELALQETQDYLNNLLNYANAPIIVWDPLFRITQFNHAFERLTGRTAEEVIGNGLDILFPEDSREHSMEHICRAVAGERWEVEEIPIQHKDGSVHIVLWNSATLYDRDNKTPTAMIAQGQDITERKKAEEALKESEERFRALANNIPQLAWMADGTGWIFWYNQRWYDYTGTNLEEMEGWGWQKVHHPDYVQPVTEKFKQYVATGEVWEDTFPLRGKDGIYRWFLSRAFPIQDTQGKVIRWFGTNTDITEKLKTEEDLKRYTTELEAANKELESYCLFCFP